MSTQDQLEQVRQEHELTCIIIINGEGETIAQVGNSPEGQEFALYSPMVMETTRRMSQCGGFGEPVCNGVILKGGRILITHQTVVHEEVIYTSLLSEKRVPSGLVKLLNTITAIAEKLI